MFEMKLFDINQFSSNANNKFNLPIINKKLIIHDNICRFMDYNKINFDDGLYYLDNCWQYIKITNNYLSLRVEFDNPYDLLPKTIWVNEINDYKSIIQHYYYNPSTDLEKNLICTIPINSSEKVYDFIDILYFSGYSISEPYEFVVSKDNLGNEIVILNKGDIIKIK
jgi:hypothetical protein